VPQGLAGRRRRVGPVLTRSSATNAFALLRLLPTSDQDEDVESLLLHQFQSPVPPETVLRRHRDLRREFTRDRTDDYGGD